MPRTSSENSSIDFRISKTNRLVVFNYSSSTSNKFQVPTATINSRIKNTGSYCKKGILNRNSEEELQQRIQNSKICNAHCLIQSQNLVKMGGTENQMLLKISKEIWQYLLKQQIKITSEYLPCSLNVEADWQSRNSNDPSEWKLCPKVFKQVCQRSGIPKSRFFCLTNYPSTLLGNSTLLVRWQMP